MKLYDNIQNVLSKRNINVTVGTVYDLMAECKEWYRGDVNDFHHYNVKLIKGTTKPHEKKTLNMAKKVCEDFSKLEWSEKIEINLESAKNTKKLLAVLNSKENDFNDNFPIFLEKLYALGTMVTIEYKKNNKTIIDYVDGDLILPFSYTNNYINGIITISRFEKEKEYYTLLTFHEYDEGLYLKTNELYISKSKDELGKEINFKAIYPNVLESELIETEHPRFQVWRLPIANNFDTGSPMGLSILANHFDKFKAIDNKYDSFDREFDLGKRRILVPVSMVKGKTLGVDDKGQTINVCYFDSDDEVYVGINGLDNEEIKDISFDLRVQEHIDGINTELNYLSAGVGLGTGYYKFDKSGGVKTATEVISENSDTYRTMVNHRNAIYSCLRDLISSICEMEGIKFKEISISTDDSIIEDSDNIRKQAMSEYNAGLISKAEYFRLTRKLKDNAASELVIKMNQEIQAGTITDGSELNINE